jgi:hypothetical protein
MNREVHVRICEGLGVKFPGATRPIAPQYPNPFRHRRNDNGSYDSICIHCFATVGSSVAEEKLEEGEKRHVCNPEILFRLATYLLPQKD